MSRKNKLWRSKRRIALSVWRVWIGAAAIHADQTLRWNS